MSRFMDYNDNLKLPATGHRANRRRYLPPGPTSSGYGRSSCTRSTASPERREQAQADYLGSYQLLLPDVEFAAEHGVQYLVDHANDVSVEAIQSSSTRLTQAKNEDAAANRLDTAATIGQLVAQIGLAASAALFGAVAGWMLTLVLSRSRSSQVRYHGDGG